MGRSGKPSAKRVDSDSDSDYPSNSVLFLSSSDDEEANKDLSLEIVERALAKDLKRKKENSEVVLLHSASTGDSELNVESTKEKKIRRKIKRKKSEKKKVEDEIAEDTDVEVLKEEQVGTTDSVVTEVKEEEQVGTTDSVVTEVKEEEQVGTTDSVVTEEKEEEQVGTTDSVVTEVNEVPVPDNAVMRKLLRGPRYFDPDEKDSIACFNCGEEGHAAVNCTMEKKKRPCFICGMLGHSHKHCTQGQDCYICKKRGHIAKNCPDKNTRASQDSILCLRCGDLGHEMRSCKNDYASTDLKEIQCYMCKNYGHFCCVDFKDDGPKEVFCYNCAQTGHTGLGCAMVRGEHGDLVDAGPSEVCYKCGEEGHFARGCTKKFKFEQWNGGSATPFKPFQEHKKKDFMGSQSAPHVFGKICKKKKTFDNDDRWNMTNGYLVNAALSEICYKCGEEGHFARECTQKFKWNGGSATPCKPFKEHKKKDFMGSQSAPHDFKKICKKKKMFDNDDRWNMTNGYLVNAGLSEVCYKCGGEGHFARECTQKFKSDQRNGGSATPRKPFKDHIKKDFMGSQSAPNDYGKIHKKKNTFDYDDGWNMTSGKSRIKGGWIVDDPDDFPRGKQRPINWNSPSTPNKQSNHKVFAPDSNGIYSTPRSPFWKRESFAGTPNSSASSSRFRNQHYNYTLRSDYNSHDYF